VSGKSVWNDVATTLWPRRDGPDGLLPPLLLSLTLVTGLVDATSYLTRTELLLVGGGLVVAAFSPHQIGRAGGER
jgi:hypothetical protein